MTKHAYFKLSDTATNAYTTRWMRDVYVKRNEIILALQRSLSADGVSLADDLIAEKITHILFNHLPPEGWLTESKKLFIGDIQLWGAKPDATTPAGRECAELIRFYEKQLRQYPDFPGWLCRELGVDAAPDMWDLKSVWKARCSRDGSGILFEVCLLDGEVKGGIPAGCQRIKHSEFVALTEE